MQNQIARRTLNGLILALGLIVIFYGRSSHLSQIEPQFKPYVESFRSELQEREIIDSPLDSLTIKLGTLNKQYLGMYYPLNHTIEINNLHWQNLSNIEKEQLMYHEMGHSMGLDHVDGYTIMRPSGFLSDKYYESNKEMLLDDMLWELEMVPFEPKETNVTKADVLDNEHAVIRFTANWCSPCKALAPVFDEVAAENPTVKVYVVDVDQNPDLARDMNVRGIPCLIKVKDKKVDTVRVGNQPKPEIQKLFK